VQLHLFFTSDGGDLSASRPGRFIAEERAQGTHWTGTGLASTLVSKLWGREKSLALLGTEPRFLGFLTSILCKICGYHSGNYEEVYLLGI
jgi:hypothetical protein